MTENGPAVPDANGIVLPTKSVPEQLLPANTLKVMVPEGLKPPEMVPFAFAEFPTTIVVADSDSVTVGAALTTVRVSVPQGLAAMLLLASPL